MDKNFNDFLFAQYWVKLLAVIVRLRRPCGLRELADFSQMSLSGTKDLLDRLVTAKILVAKKVGNKKLFDFNTDSTACDFIKQLLVSKEEFQISARARLYSNKSQDVLHWIEKAGKDIKIAKQDLHTTRNT